MRHNAICLIWSVRTVCYRGQERSLASADTHRLAMSKLFVARIPPNVTQDALNGLFSKYGTLKYINLKVNYAFVQFENIEDAQTAAKELDGHQLEGQTIVVETARDVMREHSRSHRGRFDDRPPRDSGYSRYPDDRYRRYDDRPYPRYRSRSRSRSPEYRDRYMQRSPRRYDDNRSPHHMRRDYYGSEPRYPRDSRGSEPRQCYRCGDTTHIARYCSKPRVSPPHYDQPRGADQNAGISHEQEAPIIDGQPQAWDSSAEAAWSADAVPKLEQEQSEPTENSRSASPAKEHPARRRSPSPVTDFYS